MGPTDAPPMDCFRGHSQRYIKAKKGFHEPVQSPELVARRLWRAVTRVLWMAGAQEDRVYDRVRQSKNLVGAGRAILDRPQNFPLDWNTKLAMEGWTWISNFGCFANTFVYGSLPSERVQPQNRSPPRKKFQPLPCLPGQVQWMGLKYIIVHQSKTSLSLQVQQLNGFCRVVPCKNIGSPTHAGTPNQNWNTKRQLPERANWGAGKTGKLGQ